MTFIKRALLKIVIDIGQTHHFVNPKQILQAVKLLDREKKNRYLVITLTNSLTFDCNKTVTKQQIHHNIIKLV